MIPLTTLAKSSDETLLCRMSLMWKESDNSPRGYVLTFTKSTSELEAGIGVTEFLTFQFVKFGNDSQMLR